MLNKDQKQDVDNGSTAIQAGGSVTVISNNGLTYGEVRDVALDVFTANFYKLAGIAKQTAMERAAKITEDFLSKLQKDHPTGLQKANDPDFQYALFTVQKEYAKTGDRDLGDLLVDLLVDRSKEKQRDIKQIVLNESLETAPKLTEGQLAALAVLFLFKYTQHSSVVSHQSLGTYFDKFVAPFVASVPKNRACYQHLQFCGCGAEQQLTSLSLESALGKTYQGLFLKGLEEKQILEKGLTIGSDLQIFIPCLNDNSKIQVNARNVESLEEKLAGSAITPDDRAKIKNLFDFGKMNDEEIRTKCTTIRPFMAGLFETWSSSQIKSFTLTSVGIAIGHANIKRLVGEFADLAIWIN